MAKRTDTSRMEWMPPTTKRPPRPASSGRIPPLRIRGRAGPGSAHPPRGEAPPRPRGGAAPARHAAAVPLARGGARACRVHPPPRTDRRRRAPRRTVGWTPRTGNRRWHPSDHGGREEIDVHAFRPLGERRPARGRHAVGRRQRLRDLEAFDSAEWPGRVVHLEPEELPPECAREEQVALGEEMLQRSWARG